MTVRTKRQLQALPVSENQTNTRSIPKDNWIEKISLRLKGTLTIGTANATASIDMNPYGLIKRIRLVGDGNKVIKNLDFPTLAALTQISRRTAPQFTAAGLTIGAHAFIAEAELDLFLYDCVNPLVTALDARRFTTLQLEVDWGDPEDMVTYDATTTGVLSVTELQIEVQEIPALRAAALTWNIEKYQEKEVTAVATDFTMEIARVHPIRRIIIKTLSDAVRVETIINTLNLIADGSFYFYSAVTDVSLKGDNKVNFNMETWPTGYLVLDFDRRGDLSELLIPSIYSALDFRANVANPGTLDLVRIYTQELAPVVS